MRVERTTAEIKRRGTLPSVIVTFILGLLVAFGFPLLPAHAYRTTADLEDFEGHAARWERSTINVSLEWSASESEQSDFESALSAWNGADCSGLVLNSASRGEVRIRRIDTQAQWEERGFGASVAGTTDVAYRRSEPGSATGWWVVDAEVFLNVELIRQNTLSLEAVLVHELGHAIGFLHVCELDDATAPVCQPGDSASSLHPVHSDAQSMLGATDLRGVCALYPPMRAECDPSMQSCGALGDPCESGAQCESSVCTETGFCAERCASNRDCDGRLSCVDGGCVDSDPNASGGYGAYCQRGEMCASRLCLREAQCEGTSPDTENAQDNAACRCTRRCDDNCPLGDSCEEVDGRFVCVPPSSSGCSTTSKRGFSHFGPLLLCLLFLFSRRRHGDATT